MGCPRRKEIYEALHPETRLGAHNQYSARRQNGEEQSRFTKEAVKLTDKSERTVQRDVRRRGLAIGRCGHSSDAAKGIAARA